MSILQSWKRKFKRKEHSRVDKSLGFWLPEYAHFAMFANDKLKEKRENLREITTIFNSVIKQH